MWNISNMNLNIVRIIQKWYLGDVENIYKHICQTSSWIYFVGIPCEFLS